MRFTAITLGLLILPLVASGHHSQSYFSGDFTELEGELIRVDWRNPHVRFTLRMLSTSGEEELWRTESTSIYFLHRAGVTRDMFKVGDQVKLGGHKSIRREREFLATKVWFPDGHELSLIEDISSRFEDELQDAEAEDKGIFRVWSRPRDVERVMHLPFTEAAIAARSSWDMLDNFATRCEQEGMPRIMRNPHPFEFVDQGTVIALRLELYDIVRTIHMDREAPPDDEPWSQLGYSVGSRGGGDLVVRTDRINWPYFDNIGTPQSEEVEIVERFTLSEDQSRLDYHITIGDPATFTEPATVAGHWLALGEVIAPYECEVY